MKTFSPAFIACSIVVSTVFGLKFESVFFVLVCPNFCGIVRHIHSHQMAYAENTTQIIQEDLAEIFGKFNLELIFGKLILMKVVNN